MQCISNVADINQNVMELSYLKEANRVANEIEHVRAELHVWSLVKTNSEYSTMPEGTIKMWSPGGVAADYTIDTIHADAIKALHVSHYTEYLERLITEFKAL